MTSKRDEELGVVVDNATKTKKDDANEEKGPLLLDGAREENTENNSTPPWRWWWWKQREHREAASCAALFFVCMIGMELALESANTNFPELDELAAAVTLFQFGFCFALPILASRGEALRTLPRTPRAAAPYVRLSLLVFGATALATRSLRYVAYPTKVVFKSAKLVPTMIVSTFVHRGGSEGSSSTSSSSPKYGPWDYFSAVLLCLGTAGYSLRPGNGGDSDDDGRRDSLYGVALLTVSVFCDALVPNLQQRLMATGGAGAGSLSAAAVMLNVNAVGFAGLSACMALDGSLITVARTAIAHPLLSRDLVLIGMGLSAAVLAYTRLIRASGSVAAVVVATSRKVVTVALSYVVFPNKPFTSTHVVSGLLVLAGASTNVFCRHRKQRRRRATDR